MRIVLGFFFIFITCFTLSAQEQQKLINVTGRVIALKDTSGISYVHVLNLTYPSGTISDQAGNFSILCRYGDTLQFSSVGYERAYFVARHIDSANIQHSLRIRLIPGIYLLPTVTIFPFNTSKGLTKAFLAMKRSEKDSMEMEVKKRLKITRYEIGAFPTSGISIIGIASAIYNLFSKETKGRKKYVKVSQVENKDTLINRKFNAEIVAKIIGREDPALIKDFMQHCHFSVSFITTSKNYDLYFAIKQNWLNYASERHIK